jgi:4-amino-4-deoxy-L-arabinose transferase-like glycosyltransferase
MSAPEDRMSTVEQPLDEPSLLAQPKEVVHFWRWLGVITASGLVLRLFVVVLSRHERVRGDGYEWSAQGNLNAAGHWFVSVLPQRVLSSGSIAYNLRPSASRPPGWAIILTVWAWLGQHSWFSQQILACIIGSATVLLIGLCARQLTGDRAGLVAAGVAAGYAGLWVYERALLSEILLLAEIAVFILLVYRFRGNPSILGAAVLGGMCGVMAMTRSEQILIFPLVVLPVVLAANWGAWRRAVAWLAVAMVVLLVVVAPWTIFNLGRFQRPVLLSTGLGPAVASANCEPMYYGPDIGYGELACLYPYYVGDQSVYDGKYLHNAVKYAEGHLNRLPVVVFAREGRTFGFWNPFQQTTIDAQWMNTWVGVTRLAMISYWLLLAPAIVGLVALRRRGIPLYPLLAFVLTVGVTVAPGIGDPRYRAAAEVPLVLLAATGIDALISRRRALSPRPEEPLTQIETTHPTAVISEP